VVAYFSVLVPKNFFIYLKKHPYFWASVVAHILVLYGLSHAAIKTEVVKSVGNQVRLSMHKAYKINMQNSVKNIAHLEQSLLDTLDESTKAKLDLEPVEEILAASATATPSKLVELAQQIYENIRKIERELRAKDLERAVAMSHADALKTVMSLEIAVPQYKANKMPGAEMVRSVEKFEENAKNSLRNRIDDIDARGTGEPLSKNKDNNDKAKYFGLSGTQQIVKEAKNISSLNVERQSNHSKNDFVDLWLDHIPPVNQKSPKKIAGRIIKNGANHADRIFINSWYVIGPFSISNVKAPPEYAVDLDGVYYGKDNQTVRWQYLSNASYPLILPQVDKAGIFFGYTEIILDREQDLWIWVGADDFASLRLNDNVIWESNVFNKKFNTLANNKNNIERENWNLTEYKRLAHFKAGRNSFIFKLTNSDTNAFFSLVLTK